MTTSVAGYSSPEAQFGVWPTLKYMFLNGDKLKWDPSTGIPDLSGKVAIITGANTGIGYISAVELLKKNAKVYMLCRSEARAKDAIEKILKEVPGKEKDIVFIPFDLLDIKSCKDAAKTFLSKEKKLHILMNNAGIMAWPHEIKNGVEIQFANHMGHFALTQELVPILKATAKTPGANVRIVNVASVANNYSPVPDFSSMDAANRPLKSTWERYGQSKLSNILFTYGLKKRLEGTGIRSIAIHPGVVATELTRGFGKTYPIMGSFLQWLYAKGGISISPYDGAKSQLWAAASPQVDTRNVDGQYFYPVGIEWLPTVNGRDPQTTEDLWTLSEKFVSGF